MASRLSNLTATIANGASLSGAVGLSGTTPYMLFLPAAWTAANITFQVSSDGVTYGTLFSDDGTEYTATTTYTVAASGVVRAIPVDGLKFIGANFFKVQSGTSAVPVAQGADRVITVGVKDL